jgi:hypothetical protein
VTETSRLRVRYSALAGLTIVVGLLVHTYGAGAGRVAQDVLGDALWGAMIAWGIGALAPNTRLVARSAAAYAWCVAVETSQLYHAPTIDAIRATWPGHLVLGSGFDARDLGSYALGVACAALADAVWRRSPGNASA